MISFRQIHNLKSYMNENKKVFLEEMKKIHKRLDRIEKKINAKSKRNKQTTK